MRRLPRTIDKPTELLGFRMDEIGVFVIDDDSRAEHQVPDAEIVDVHLQVEQFNLLDRFGQQLLDLSGPGRSRQDGRRKAARGTGEGHRF